jgi:hypothetical protein
MPPAYYRGEGDSTPLPRVVCRHELHKLICSSIGCVPMYVCRQEDQSRQGSRPITAAQSGGAARQDAHTPMHRRIGVALRSSHPQPRQVDVGTSETTEDQCLDHAVLSQRHRCHPCLLLRWPWCMHPTPRISSPRLSRCAPLFPLPSAGWVPPPLAAAAAKEGTREEPRLGFWGPPE